MADDVVVSEGGEDSTPLIEDVPNSDGMEGVDTMHGSRKR